MSNRESLVRHYKNVMNQPAENISQKQACYGDVPHCQECEHYEPFFKYRKCLYPICPKGHVKNVFLDKPLREDILVLKGFADFTKENRKELGQ